MCVSRCALLLLVILILGGCPPRGFRCSPPFVRAAGDDDALERWRKLLGPRGFVHPGLELRDRPQTGSLADEIRDGGTGGTHRHAIFARQPIVAYEVLLQVPIDRILAVSALDWAHPALRWPSRKAPRGLDQHELISVYLAALRKFADPHAAPDPGDRTVDFAVSLKQLALRGWPAYVGLLPEYVPRSGAFGLQRGEALALRGTEACLRLRPACSDRR